jgi:opacity protein-like surface antigen
MKQITSIFTILATIATLVLSTSHSAAAEHIRGPYLRVDGGYGYGKEKLNSSLNNKLLLHKTGKGSLGSIGLGTSINRYFRTELQLYFDQGFKAGNNKNNISKAREKTTAGFVNGILDFPNSTPLTPYLLGGAGFARNRFSVLDGGIQFKSPIKNRFAWQTGVGLSFQLSKSIELDASYRFVDKGNSKYSARSSQSADYITARIRGNNTAMLGLKVYINPGICNCKNNT